jgi:hypothetical protein
MQMQDFFNWCRGHMIKDQLGGGGCEGVRWWGGGLEGAEDGADLVLALLLLLVHHGLLLTASRLIDHHFTYFTN